MSYILVTGGAGYIGSHTVIELINSGFKVVIVDNLSNASYDAVSRIEFLVGQHIPFYNVDLRNSAELSKVFDDYPISGVIHFAALKAVGESTKIPLKYYNNNINGTVSLLEVMQEKNVKTFVFSSSATVYGDVTRFGDNRYIPIPEECPKDPTNPYGNTKFMIEAITKDIHTSDPTWKFAMLRYFNPIGAHPSGIIGEDPLGIPNNLLPYLAQVASGRRDKLSIFGNDYNSHDGTPIRDYIHVIDLAKGHIAALEYLKNLNEEGLYRAWNLGTGEGSTVFDVYHAFCKAVGRDLPHEVVGRRDGDVLNLTANSTRANTELKWKTELNIENACKDLWKWTQENPYGFQDQYYNWTEFDGLLNRLHKVKRGDLEVELINYGATLKDIKFKGKSIVTTFETAEEFSSPSNPYFGATVGRFANRIKDGKFSIGGESFQATKNEKENCLHGGKDAMDKKLWFGPVVKSDSDSTSLTFTYTDCDGNDGFPGNLKTNVIYKITEESLEIEFEATTDKSTIANFTNHVYFNLSEEENINSHKVTLFTNKRQELIEAIPSGKIIEEERIVAGKEFELTEFYDDCFVVEDNSGIDTRSNEIKELVHARSNTTKMIVSSTEPSFQLYTGDFINVGKYGPRSGFAVEPTRYVDAINHKEWEKQVILNPGDVYGSIIKFKFESV